MIQTWAKRRKRWGSGLLVQDAFLEWKINNTFRVDGGIMLVPFSHNGLQSTASYLNFGCESVERGE
jgi:hypothetical protein